MQRLGDYIKEYSVRNKLDEDIPVYSVTNSNGFCCDYFGKEIASNNKKTYKIVPRNAFAYNPSRINVGSVDYQHYEDRVIVSPLYNVFMLDEKILPQYLYFYLKNPNTMKRIRTVASGSVRDNLKLSILCEFPIQVPSINRQQNIIEILEKTQRIIDEKSDELEKLNNLIKARFIEMFGDVYRTPKYPKQKWNEVVTIKNGKDYKKVAVKDGGYPVYGTGGEMARVREFLCPENTIIVGRKGTINNPLLVREKFWNVDTAFGVIPGIKLHYLYFFWFCKMFDFSRLNRQAVLPSTTKADLLNIEIQVPPIEVQNQFATFVTQVDKSKFAVQKSLEKTQLLFDSLMQEYFG